MVKKRKVKKRTGLSIPKEWKLVFLEALRETKSVRRACELSGVSWSLAYTERERDKEFTAKWKETMQIIFSDLEGAAMKRATDGTDVPVMVGTQVRVDKKYETALTIFMLKAHGGAQYQFEHQRPDIERQADVARTIRQALKSLDGAVPAPDQ